MSLPVLLGGRGFPELEVLGWGRGGLRGEGSSVVGVGWELVLGDDPVGLYRLGGHGRSSSGGEGPDSWGVENSIAYLFGRVWGHGERSPARVYGSL